MGAVVARGETYVKRINLPAPWVRLLLGRDALRFGSSFVSKDNATLVLLAISRQWREEPGFRDVSDLFL